MQIRIGENHPGKEISEIRLWPWLMLGRGAMTRRMKEASERGRGRERERTTHGDRQSRGEGWSTSESNSPTGLTLTASLKVCHYL